MRHLVLILIAVVTLAEVASAQTASPQYIIDQRKYDHRTWTYQEGDPYDPYNCAVLSFIIPGVGQTVTHEFGRGLHFFIGELAGTVLFIVAIDKVRPPVDDVATEDHWMGITPVIVGLTGMLVFRFWSAFDAAQVAKVKNLAWQDRNNTGLHLNLEPYVHPIQTYQSSGTQVGLSLKFSF